MECGSVVHWCIGTFRRDGDWSTKLSMNKTLEIEAKSNKSAPHLA
jgi:hypothetical protein